MYDSLRCKQRKHESLDKLEENLEHEKHYVQKHYVQKALLRKIVNKNIVLKNKFVITWNLKFNAKNSGNS